MISDEWRRYEQRARIRSASYCCAEAGRSRSQGGGCGAAVWVSKHAIHGWKAKCGGFGIERAPPDGCLKYEDARLKLLVADLSLDREMLKAVIATNGLSSLTVRWIQVG
jgi:putative transposase